MNLAAMTMAQVAEVNPRTAASIQVSTGYATDASGKSVPQYAAPVDVMAQVQALTGKDLRQVEGLNLNGTVRAIYVYGELDGAVRVNQKGGDLLTFGGQVWLTNLVVEQWNDWCKVVATLQNGQ